jgi:hypothetical protein
MAGHPADATCGNARHQGEIYANRVVRIEGHFQLPPDTFDRFMGRGATKPAAPIEAKLVILSRSSFRTRYRTSGESFTRTLAVSREAPLGSGYGVTHQQYPHLPTKQVQKDRDALKVPHPLE